MPDVLICYEHINREVENDTLLCCELEKRGISCEIIHFNGCELHRYTKKRNRAKIVLTPWLRYDENVFHYFQMTDSQHLLLNLQWEQVYDKKDLESGLCAISGQSTKAYHICWGKNTEKRLLESGVEKNRLFVTNAIQLDYAYPLFNDYYFDRTSIASEFSLNSKKRWCLFVSSLAYANYDEASIDELINDYGEYIGKIVDLHKSSQKEILEWIKVLLCDNRDIEFVYRPHPTEKVCEQLIEMQNNINNFHIISEYSVKQWAKVCDSVSMWASTSNAEFVSMGINYEILRPVPIPEDLEVESMLCEKFITKCDDFVDYSLGRRKASFTIEERKKMLQPFYDYTVVKPAYMGIADVVERLIESKSRCDFHFSLKQWIMYGIKEMKIKLFSFCAYQVLQKGNSIINLFPFNNMVKNNILKSVKNYHVRKSVEKRMKDYYINHTDMEV